MTESNLTILTFINRILSFISFTPNQPNIPISKPSSQNHIKTNPIEFLNKPILSTIQPPSDPLKYKKPLQNYKKYSH